MWRTIPRRPSAPELWSVAAGLLGAAYLMGPTMLSLAFLATAGLAVHLLMRSKREARRACPTRD